MKALLTIDAPVFHQAPDGRVYTQSVATYDDYWAIPRSSFEQLVVMTRLLYIDKPDGRWRLADGDGVTFRSVPWYHGPFQYLQVAMDVRASIKAALEECDVLLGNGPGNLSRVGIDLAGKLRKLYALDVLGDPYDVYAPGAVKHPLRPLFRWWFTKELRHQCAGACAVNYVTEQALQRRYPPAPEAFSMYASDVHLPDAALVSVPRPICQEARAFSVITVGTLAQLYKAQDVLIDAIATCVRDGLDLKLILVGDGKHRVDLEARSAALGISERVYFRGLLPAGSAVREQLDRADLFVLPSRQEGLPKAMIEAMARALPCIGSTVGGIPELLAAEDLVSPGDVNALAHKISEVVTNPERMARMSARNLEKARGYRQDVLRERRIAFYRHVRERTEAWLKAKER